MTAIERRQRRGTPQTHRTDATRAPTTALLSWAWILLLWLTSAAAAPATSNPPPAANREPSAQLQRIVVESCNPESAAAAAGLRPGDELLSWQRLPTSPRLPAAASGPLLTPFHFDEVELEHGPLGPVVLHGQRGGLPRVWTVGPEAWDFTVRAFLHPDDRALYQQGWSRQADVQRGPVNDAWTRLAQQLQTAGDHGTAAWLYVLTARQIPADTGWAAAEEPLDAAARAAVQSGDTLVQIHVVETRGRIAERFDQLGKALKYYHAALDLRQQQEPQSLGVARVLNFLGVATGRHGKVHEAGILLNQALEICLDLAPEGQSTATVLNNLGIVHRRLGDLEQSEMYFKRSLDLAEHWTPNSMSVVRALMNLGLLQQTRGDLVTAQTYLQRALDITEQTDPRSPERTRVLYNLGTVSYFRGDLEGAETLVRRSLEREAPQSLGAAGCLSLLGSIAFVRSDLEAAEAYHLQALEINRQLSPGSPNVSLNLSNLSDVAARRGQLLQARAYQERAQALLEKRLPDSLPYSLGLHNLGQLALRQGELDAAERYQRQALEIQRAIDPNSLSVARSLHLLATVLSHSDAATAVALLEESLGPSFLRPAGTLEEAEAALQLARLYRQQGQLTHALSLHQRALRALEAQQLRAGGSAENHSLFAVEFSAYYHEMIELLQQARPPAWQATAFEISERYRARGLLRLMARRDLSFDQELPAALQRERRLVNAEYDRLYAELTTTPVSQERGEELRQRLIRVRQEQHELASRIRTEAPKLADLDHAVPLDLTAARAALDPGTLLLSYVIGEATSFLFAVGPGRSDFAMFELTTSHEPLAAEVERLRGLLARGTTDARVEPVLAHSRRLSALLLAPATDQIHRAERLLLVADGPLHRLPFGVLADPSVPGPPRYLAQSKSLHFAASVTVLAQLKDRRRADSAQRLVAFGDPEYTREAVAGTPASGSLPQLPGSRAEVRALQRLFPESLGFLGDAATEERVKALAGQADLVHFACHGLLNDRSPFESALALALPKNENLPEPGREERENGLLQVWEIFEELRLDADLVTLSACDTALGTEAGGEGLIGLTRAFQFAGARSVLASQWQVDDASTSQLMQRFYHYLRQGKNKAESLRLAKMDLLALPGAAHPFHWAGFQLNGDWR